VIGELIKTIVCDWPICTDNVLDLACGSGEVTLALINCGIISVNGIDPYTENAYRTRTGKEAGKLTFAQISNGELATKTYSLIICSFALHLLQSSELPLVLLQLSVIAPNLVIITPNKKPTIDIAMGWSMLKEIELSRVKARLYQSTQLI